MGGARFSVVALVGCGLALGCAGSAGTAHAPTAATSARTPAQVRAAQVESLLASGREFARQKRGAEAELQLRQAVKLAWGFGEPWVHYRAEALAELARCLVEQHRGAEARDVVAQALGLTTPGSLADDHRISDLQLTKAEAFRAEREPLSAVEPFTAAVEAASRHPSELSTPFVEASLKLAETLEILGRHQAATKTLERALEVAKQSADAAPFTANIARALSAIYEASGEPRRARELLAEYPGLAQASPGATRGPLPAAPSPSAAKSSASGDTAALEVASMQADFRACYRASLADDYDLGGKVELVIRLAADGRVANVKATGPSLPPTTVDCLLRRAALARFDPPENGASTITVPVTFVNQD